MDVVNNELHAVENARVAARAVGIEDLDSNELNVLGHSKGSTANSASNVAAVAVLIGVLSTSMLASVHQVQVA